MIYAEYTTFKRPEIVKGKFFNSMAEFNRFFCGNRHLISYRFI